MPRSQARGTHESGFTLVEALITVAILGLIALIGLPSFLGTLNRSRLTGASRELASFFQVARLEAIKKNTNVKVLFDSNLREFYAFLDNDLDGVEDSPGERRLSSVVILPIRIQARGPGEATQYGPGSIDGWDDAPAVDGPSFRRDGSVDRVGAFRLADNGENVLEVRVETAATGRVVIKKWDRVATKFYASHENNEPWPWY